MKQLNNKLTSERLNAKHWAAGTYFAIFLCLLLCIGDDSSISAILFVVANFIASAVIASMVEWPKTHNGLTI